jgi:hypothetical protein
MSQQKTCKCLCFEVWGWWIMKFEIMHSSVIFILRSSKEHKFAIFMFCTTPFKFFTSSLFILEHFFVKCLSLNLDLDFQVCVLCVYLFWKLILKWASSSTLFVCLVCSFASSIVVKVVGYNMFIRTLGSPKLFHFTMNLVFWLLIFGFPSWAQFLASLWCHLEIFSWAPFF